jgi:hypothetical protein
MGTNTIVAIKEKIKDSRVFPVLKPALVPYRAGLVSFYRCRAAYRRRKEKSLWLMRRHLKQSDIFLVGHPKSGNTWLAYMLAILLNKDKERQITVANVGRYVPVVHGKDGTIGRFRMLHEPRVFRNEYPIHPDAYPKTIYLIRDPRAALISYYHMYRAIKDDNQLALDGFINEYLVHGCIRSWEPDLKRWDKQVLDWIERAADRNRVLIVKYEDMVHDVRKVLPRVLDFIGVLYNEEDLALAAGRGSFESMRTSEERHGAESYLRIADRKHEHFFRRGKVDSWKDEMDSTIVHRIEDDFADAMLAAGYELSRSKPAMIA